FGHVHHRDVVGDAPPHAGAPPVRVLDFDLARVDDPAHHGDMTEPHAAIGTEGKHAAGLRHAAAFIDASGVVPPFPSVARHGDARGVSREGYTRYSTAACIVAATPHSFPMRRGMRSALGRVILPV